MVFFAMTRQGVDAFRQLSRGRTASLWISAGVLTPAELSELRMQGFGVTSLSAEIHAGDREPVADAISTIKEHHPGEPLWVEA